MEINNKSKCSSPLSHLFLFKSLETGINTTLNMFNNRIINVLTGSSDSDVATLGFVEDLLQTPSSEKYLTLTGTKPNESVTGDLTFDGKSTVSNISSPINDTDAVPLSYISSITNKFLTTKGTSNEDPFTGDISFDDSHLITGLVNPTNPSDAVNLQTLLSHTQGYFLITGDTLSGPLNINNQTLSNLANPSDPTDAANIQTIGQLVASTQEMFIPLSGTVNNKPITGNLNLDNTKITNLGIATETSEAVNLDLLNKTLNNHLPLSGNTSSKPIRGNFVFDTLHLITGLNSPEDPQDAVNLLSLTTVSNKYLSLKGGSLTGGININNKNITNVPDLTDESDLSRLINQKTLNNKFSSYLPLSGGTLTGSLNCNNNTLSNIPTPVDSEDLVNKTYLTSYLNTQSSLLIPRSGNNIQKEISGNLTFSNALITGLANPTNSTDAVNLQTLNSNFSPYMPLSGGTLSGSLNMSSLSITNVSDPINNTDAVYLKYAQDYISQKQGAYLKLSGTETNFPITGNLTFNNALITGLANPTNSTDAVNLQTLNSNFSPYMPLSGGTLSGELNLNDQKIINLSDPINNDDAVNYSYLQTLLSNNFKQKIPLSETLENLPITKNINLGNKFTLLNLPEATKTSEPINLSQLTQQQNLYLPLSGGTLNNLNMANSKITHLPLAEQPSQLTSLKNLSNVLANYLPLTGTSLSSVLTNNLTFNNSSLITGLAFPTENLDAINLQALNTTKNNYFPLFGGNLTGPLSTKEILNIKDSLSSSSAVSYKEAQSSLSQKILSLTGNSIANPLDYNFIFNNSSLITGLKDPVDTTDAVNLETMNKSFSLYLPLSGGIMTGDINANNQIINNLSSNSEKNNSQALIVEDVKNFYEPATISLASTTSNPNPIIFESNKFFQFIVWSSLNHTTTGNSDTYKIDHYVSYENTTLVFLKPGLYLFTFNLLSQENTDISYDIILTFVANPEINETYVIAHFQLGGSSSIHYTTPIYCTDVIQYSYIFISNLSNSMPVFGINYSAVKLI